MTSPRWCCGFGTQPPHLPDDQALVRTNVGPDVVMCRACWTRWVRDDREVDRG